MPGTVPGTLSSSFIYIVSFNLQDNSEGVVYNLDYCMVVIRKSLNYIPNERYYKNYRRLIVPLYKNNYGIFGG